MDNTGSFCMLREEDFLLFAGDSPTDRRFNKNRLDLKERLRKLGELHASLVPEGWTMESGAEHPAVWNRQQVDRLELFFMRGEEERKKLNRALSREIPMSLLLQSPSPLYAHASLGFFVDAQGLEVGFRVPFLAVADRRQMRMLMEKTPGGLDELASELGCGAMFGVFYANTHEAFSAHSPQGWMDALDRLEAVGAKDHRAYAGFVWRLSPAQAVEPGRAQACVASAFSQLLPFARNYAWSSERDCLGIDGMITAQTRASQAQWEQSEKMRQELVAPKPVVARPILSSRDAQTAKADAGRQSAARKPAENARRRFPQGAASSSSAPANEQAPKGSHPARPGKSQAATQLREAKDAPASRKPKPDTKLPANKKDWAPGDAAVLETGPFAGKEAVVLSILADGQVRVRVGMMQLLVQVEDLRQARK